MLVSRLAKVHGRTPTYDECVTAAKKEGVKLPTGLNDVRIHDLRHNFASIAAGAGLSLHLIGKLLGHTQSATTARYAHLADDPMREGVNLIGMQITAAMAPIVAQRTTRTRKRRVRLND
jgi:integrase